MDNNNWYDKFVEMLYKKFQKKTQLTQALMKLLELEREAVYRRLRKDVFFSANEIVKIACTWGISLDEATNINADQFSFQMRQINYFDPSDEERAFLRKVIDAVNFSSNFPTAEFLNICNKLPRLLIAGFDYLNHFFLFKWKYLYSNESKAVPFSKIYISEEKRQISKECFRAMQNIPNTNLIFDRKIFEYLINDILYFHSIYLITDEEKELIKKDVFELLNYLQEVANNGYYSETKNKVNLYISQLNVETNYSYAYTPEAKACFLIVFDKNEIYSLNSEMVTNFMAWMQLRKRTSTQISEVDEKSRIEFFTAQRQIIDCL